MKSIYTGVILVSLASCDSSPYLSEPEKAQVKLDLSKTVLNISGDELIDLDPKPDPKPEEPLLPKVKVLNLAPGTLALFDLIPEVLENKSNALLTDKGKQRLLKEQILLFERALTKRHEAIKLDLNKSGIGDIGRDEVIWSHIKAWLSGFLRKNVTLQLVFDEQKKDLLLKNKLENSSRESLIKSVKLLKAIKNKITSWYDVEKKRTDDYWDEYLVNLYRIDLDVIDFLIEKFENFLKT